VLPEDNLKVRMRMREVSWIGPESFHETLSTKLHKVVIDDGANSVPQLKPGSHSTFAARLNRLLKKSIPSEIAALNG
jgi:hypothetical protein